MNGQPVGEGERYLVSLGNSQDKASSVVWNFLRDTEDSQTGENFNSQGVTERSKAETRIINLERVTEKMPAACTEVKTE